MHSEEGENAAERAGSVDPELRPVAGDWARTSWLFYERQRTTRSCAGWVRLMRCVARPSWASGWPS